MFFQFWQAVDSASLYFSIAYLQILKIFRQLYHFIKATTMPLAKNACFKFTLNLELAWAPKSPHSEVESCMEYIVKTIESPHNASLT